MRVLTSSEMLWVSGGNDTGDDDGGGDGGGGDGDDGGGGGGGASNGPEYGFDDPGDYSSIDPTVTDIFYLPTQTIVGTKGATVGDVETAIGDAIGNANWSDVFGGLGIVGGVITAIALAPAAVPIFGVAGLAALSTELAGLGLVLVGTAGHH